MPTVELSFEAARSIIYTFAALLGACFGSFMSVCIWRMPRNESIVFPRSHCPSCNKLIPWYHNIPILSWLLLRGRCAECKAKISPRYLLLELLTAALFLAVTWRFMTDPSVMVVMWLVVFGFELGTFIDIDWYILPDSVTIGGMVLGLAVSPLLPQLHGTDDWLLALLRSVIGLCTGFGILYLVAVLGKLAYKKEAMGFGDVKLLGAVGALFGWKGALFTLFGGAFLGSIIGVFLIFRGKRELQGRIPFGPFLAAAALLWLFFGEEILDWYFSLLLPKE